MNSQLIQCQSRTAKVSFARTLWTSFGYCVWLPNSFFFWNCPLPSSVYCTNSIEKHIYDMIQQFTSNETFSMCNSGKLYCSTVSWNKEKYNNIKTNVYTFFIFCVHMWLSTCTSIYPNSWTIMSFLRKCLIDKNEDSISFCTRPVLWQEKQKKQFCLFCNIIM